MNDQDAFLAELARQQAADSDPTSQTVADALGWDVFDRTSQLLDRLENRGLVKTTMPPARSGDTHLDHWVTLTAEGRVHAQASRVEANATQALGSGERWTRIDRPVLLELAQASESDEGVVRVDDIAARHDLRYRDVLKSVDTLKRTGFVDTQLDPDSGGEYSFIRLTQKGLEATELWPTPATALDRMISALEAMAENSDDEDTRTRARKILDGFAGAGRQVAIGVATAVATGQIPQ